MAAECVGCLMQYSPSAVIRVLEREVKSPESSMRASMLTALRYTFPLCSPQAARDLKPRLGDLFSSLIDDSALSVRAATLLALNAAVRHRAELVTDLLPDLMPKVLALATPQPELERTVDMGCFKHKVDEGLPLRVAAWTCIRSLLECHPETVDAMAMMPVLCVGVGEDKSEEVRSTCYGLVQLLCTTHPQIVRVHVSALAPPLGEFMTKWAKRKAGRRTHERDNGMALAAARSLRAMEEVPGMGFPPALRQALLALEASNALDQDAIA